MNKDLEEKMTSTFKEFELGYGYNIRQNGEFNVIFKGETPITILKNDNKIYNQIFDFKPRAKNIVMKKDKITINFTIETQEYKNHDLDGFKVNIGYVYYDFTKSDEIYHIEIPYNTIKISGKTAGIFLTFKDKNGFIFKKKFLSMTGPHNNQNHDIYTSKLHTSNNHSIYIYETWTGYLTLTYRETNITDSFKEQKKIKSAFIKQKLDSKLGKNTPSILLYEKFCGKYEESGKYVYEKLIDDGCENVYFILDKESEYYKKVPKKYRKNIIDRFSFKHYYEYFNAKAFISTETFFHAIEVTNYNSLVRLKRMWDNFYYFFLQHGVTYAYSLKERTAFTKGLGFRDNSFVVISSEKEGEHFIKEGKFDREDLIKSGIPKFDYATKNQDADKILIMPTTRNFEYSTIMDNTKNSTYYNFVKRIIESVPEELKDKIVFIPHPIINKIIKKTDLNQYTPNEYSYDNLLKDTRLLITDYSSISFDAFYRGCNLIFAWMEKEMCLESMDMELMLNEDNAFADIAYDYDTLSELISKNYYQSHRDKYNKKFNEIVEFHDGKNTERFIEYIYNTNLFPNKSKKVNMKDVIIEGVEDYPYNGKNRKLPKLKLNYKGKKLVKNLDFELKIKNNKDIGTATAKIKGKGIYSGHKTIKFEIKKDINECEFEIKKDNISVIIDDYILINEKDYIYKIINYPKVYIKEIIIKGIGKYSGSKNILIEYE